MKRERDGRRERPRGNTKAMWQREPWIFIEFSSDAGKVERKVETVSWSMQVVFQKYHQRQEGQEGLHDRDS